MKTPEILLASSVIAVVAGVGTALATRAFQDAPVRVEPESRVASEPAAVQPASAERALDELRMENTTLKERLAALEARLDTLASARTPLAAERADTAALSSEGHAGASESTEDVAVDDDFVASVGRALDEIQRKDDAKREQKRKEQQAQRVEERVTQMQQELGLSNRQASDVRTALIAADDKRAAMFDSLRDAEGDPRDLREGFRTLRDDTLASMKTILTPEQYETFRKNEEQDNGRRGFGDFGPPDGGGGPGPDRARTGRRAAGR